MKLFFKYIFPAGFFWIPKIYFGQSINELKQCALECEQQLDFKTAIIQFDNVLELNPKDTITYIDRAMAKEYLQNYIGAITDYTEITKLDPENPDGYFLRALAEEKIHNYTNAIIDYEKALSMENDNADANYHLGLCLVLQKKYNEAGKYFDKAFEVNKEHVNSLASKAWLEITLNNYQGAKVSCKNALAIDAYNSKTNGAYAYLLCKDGLYDEAIPYYLTAIKYATDDDTIAVSTLYQKKLQLALSNYCKKNSFSNDSAYVDIGKFYSLLHDDKQAIEYYTKVLKRSFHQKALYYSALSYMNIENYKSAINQLTILLNKNTTEEKAYLLRAKAYVFLQQNRAALLDYNMAVLVNPYNPIYYLERSKLKYKMGYPTEACSDLKKSKELGVDFILKPDFSICP
jgi:tetratricopeptide (TPR) repeat protein